MAYTLLLIFLLIAVTEGTIRPFQNGAFCRGLTTSLQQRRLPMEESSIPWHFKSYGVHSPYFRMIYLLFIFSIGFLFIVQIASGAETLEAPSAKIEQNASITTLASSRIAITPVRKSKSDRFNPVIKRAADRYEVDPALIKAVIMAESAYNPKAVSKQGAKGLMQLMPGTARALGVKNAFDPSHNINGGAKYLRQLLNAFDENIKLALAAYNAGISKVKRHGAVPPIKATQRYVKKVFAYYHHYKSEMVDETKEV